MNEFLKSEIKMLLVDDDPLVRRSLRMILELHEIPVVGKQQMVKMPWRLLPN